jgi:hypothetical protein
VSKELFALLKDVNHTWTLQNWTVRVLSKEFLCGDKIDANGRREFEEKQI